MIRTILVAALALACVVSNAEARPKHRKAVQADCGFFFCPETTSTVSKSSYRGRTNWTKPRAWCGWWMRKHLGVANPAGNRARWWAGYGSRANGPAVGVIVVWARGRRSGHVGIITGRNERGWIVKSGNDGHAVRERVRSVANAIAFRWPHGSLASRGQAL